MSELKLLSVTVIMLFMFLSALVVVKTKSKVLQSVLVGFIVWLMMLLLFFVGIIKASLEAMAVIPPLSLAVFLLFGLIIGAHRIRKQ